MGSRSEGPESRDGVKKGSKKGHFDPLKWCFILPHCRWSKSGGLDLGMSILGVRGCGDPLLTLFTQGLQKGTPKIDPFFGLFGAI